MMVRSPTVPLVQLKEGLADRKGWRVEELTTRRNRFIV
jgi:hypothetical protein